jgi:ABC-type proline/glycine betaine transport system permease subunit
VTKNSKQDVVQRMQELMKPIDRQIMMCDNVDDVLMLASNMLVTAKMIYVQNLGGAGTKEILQKMVDEIDERILPVHGKIPPEDYK